MRLKTSPHQLLTNFIKSLCGALFETIKNKSISSKQINQKLDSKSTVQYSTKLFKVDFKMRC